LNTLTISRVEQVVEVVKVSRGDLSAIARQAESAAELKQVLAAFTDDELRGLCRTDFLTPRGTSSGSTAWETTLLYGVPVTDDTDEGETEFVPFSLSLGMTTLVRNPSLERALRRGFGAYPIPHHGTMFDYSHAIASLFGVFTIVSGTTDSLDLVSLQRRPEIGPVSNVTMSAVRAATRYGATSPNQLRVEQVGECRELWTNLADAYSAIHLFEFARFSHALHDTKGVDRTAAALTQYDSNFGVSTSVGSVVWNGVIRLLDSGGVTAAAARYDFSGAGATGPWITNLHLGLLSETSDLVQDQEGRRPCLSPPPLPLPAEKAQIGWLQAEALAAAPWRVMSGPLGRSMADRRQFAQDQAVSFRLSNESRPKSIRAAIDFAAMVAKASESDEPAELQRRAQVAADEAALLATSEARLRSLLASDHVIRSATGQLVYELTGDGNSALFDRSDSQVLVVRAMTEISLPPVTQPAAVGEVLGHGEALLTYLVGDTEVVMIVAHNDDGKVSWTSVRTGRAEMEGPVLDCVDALSRSTAVSEASLEQVSRLLLPDKVIEAIGDAKSLIVMPQSFLWRVPFGALKFGQLRLYERMQVGYVESLSLLRQIKSTTGRQGTGDFLSVGGVDPSRAERTSLLDTTGLPVLKLSTDQAKEVVQVVGGVANLQSSEAGVKESLRSARLVHFGTHGVVPPIGRDQVWSALILESGNGDDGLLQPAEIFGAGPFTSLDLVTLIACQSGATQDSMGPFNRAFLYSGAQTVVSTHWAIGEDVGDLFTRKFYGTLAEGKTSFEAMRAAIDAVREQYPEEHHWAPYALYGIGTNRPGKR
jgi:CHAT domain-containing protein